MDLDLPAPLTSGRSKCPTRGSDGVAGRERSSTSWGSRSSTRLTSWVSGRPRAPIWRAVHAVIEDAFAEWEGRVRRAYEDWRAMIVDRDGIDPAHFRVARAGGEIIGVAAAHDSAGTTWIPQLAVRSDRRGQGIAQELLAEAFEAGRQRGCATGELST